ncbi:MAG TPA: hypothetical protein PLA25_04265, partial [Anaerolineaceae bacterium]|nr:hypothetical protein [Anaerolineaceae bacterium]
PIYVAQEVLNTAGVTPEEDVQQTPQSVTSPAPAKSHPLTACPFLKIFFRTLTWMIWIPLTRTTNPAPIPTLILIPINPQVNEHV